jgi:DNA-binding beta-propeller fold protein YncE
VIDVAVTPDGRTAVATSFSNQRVSFVDLSVSPPVVTGSLQAPIFAEDVHISVTPSGYAVVADGGNSTTVFSINIAAQQIVNSVQLPLSAEGITVLPDRGIVLINSFNAPLVVGNEVRNVRVLNLAADGRLSDTGVTVPSGGVGAINLEPSPTGQLALVANWSSNSVGVVRIALDGTVSQGETVSMGAGFSAPQSIAFRADGRRAYVANDGGLVRILDINADGVVTLLTNDGVPVTITVGGSKTAYFGVDHLAMVSSGQWLLLHLANVVAIIDPATNTVVGTIPIPNDAQSGGISAIP